MTTLLPSNYCKSSIGMNYQDDTVPATKVVGIHADFPFCWWRLDDLKKELAPGTCTYCQEYPYCSEECQQRHWNCHKLVCETFLRLEKEREKELSMQPKEHAVEQIGLLAERIAIDWRREREKRHGVAGFPPMGVDMILKWNYLHLLSKEQVFRILVDLFLETIYWERGMRDEDYDDRGKFITSIFANDKVRGFREYLRRAKEAEILPGNFGDEWLSEIQYFALDDTKARTIHAGIGDCELSDYYGSLAYAGFIQVYKRLFPEMGSGFSAATADEG